MEQIVFSNPQEIVTNMNTGNREKDLEVVNAVLSGNIAIKQEETIQEPTPSTDEVVSVEDKIEPQISINETLEFEEAERQKRYIEMLEKRRQEEKEELLREKREKEEELAREKKLREDFEKRIREIESRQQNEPSQVQLNVQDDDEEYVSEYTKKTRLMVEELRNKVGTNPEFEDRIRKIEEIFEKDAQERKKIEELKKKQEQEEKLFSNIRHFLMEHPELKPQKDICEIDKDYKRFRQDIAYISGARNIEELEKAIDDYRKNGKIKELADKNGVVDVPDIDKYNSIVDLIDFKEGLQYDPVTGKHIPILDEHGVQVRYRSLDEAFKIKNYYSDMSNIKRQAFREVSSKLEQFNNAPVTLKPENTDTFTSGISIEQEREILNMHPREWENNLEKRKLAELVYAKRGLPLPKYRGR